MMIVVRSDSGATVIRNGQGPMGQPGAGFRDPLTLVADHDARDGDRLTLDSTDGAFTVTLPSDEGQVWISSVGDTLSTNAVTLDGNGKTIDGAATLALDGDAAGYLLHFSSQGDAWLYTLTYQHGAA